MNNNTQQYRAFTLGTTKPKNPDQTKGRFLLCDRVDNLLETDAVWKSYEKLIERTEQRDITRTSNGNYATLGKSLCKLATYLTPEGISISTKLLRPTTREGRRDTFLTVELYSWDTPVEDLADDLYRICEEVVNSNLTQTLIKKDLMKGGN